MAARIAAWVDARDHVLDAPGHALDHAVRIASQPVTRHYRQDIGIGAFPSLPAGSSCLQRPNGETFSILSMLLEQMLETRQLYLI